MVDECITETFGTKLKKLRKQKGITQESMACIINTSRSCISNYESGNRQPDNETIKLIADFLNVSVDYLLGRSQVKTIFKNEDTVCKIQELVSRLNLVNSIDLTHSPEYIRCATVEFYTYLNQKEK